MLHALRSEKWKFSLGASLLLNIVLLFVLLRALNAQAETAEPEIREVAVVVTATSEPTAEAEQPEPSPTPTATATTSPTNTPQPTVTATPIPTGTPAPSPTATATPSVQPSPSWLGYVNHFREQGGLPPVTEDANWSLGSEAHSRYMVKTDVISHSQDDSSPWYTQAGLDAAQNGNIAATSWFDAPPEWAIDYWLSAPFHAVPMLDPQLRAAGFGWYREQDGGVVFAANMDILRGLDQEFLDVTYPLMFPRDGGVANVRQSVLYEYPDPLTACPGYVKPTGPPIILQVGAGSGTPTIGGSSFRTGETALDHCTFGETTYVNPDAAAQRSGRRVLDVRDAIVLIPRLPLVPGQAYTANIVVDGQPISWSFAAAELP